MVLRPSMHAEDDRSVADRHIVKIDPVHSRPLVCKCNHSLLLSAATNLMAQSKVCFAQRQFSFNDYRESNCSNQNAKQSQPTPQNGCAVPMLVKTVLRNELAHRLAAELLTPPNFFCSF